MTNHPSRAFGFLLVTAAVACALAEPVDATAPGEAVLTVSGETVPAKLSSSHDVPVALRAGFTSETPGSSTTPELTRVAIEITHDLEFKTAGLPSCPIAALSSPNGNARRACAGSLVGHGFVDSEITLPGQAPARVKGSLLAFYALAEGAPHILAQVTTGEPLPLVYVIPFEIGKARGALGTRLTVQRMSNIQGLCPDGHPNCFAQPYKLKGFYGHISKLELSLHRLFAHAGQRKSFVIARCPISDKRSAATFPFARATAHYAGQIASQSSRSAVLRRTC